MLIEMAAYQALHNTDSDNWRCMKCEKLGKFSEENICRHLIEVHGIVEESIKKEHGNEIFLYPLQKGGIDGKSSLTQ